MGGKFGFVCMGPQLRLTSSKRMIAHFANSVIAVWHPFIISLRFITKTYCNVFEQIRRVYIERFSSEEGELRDISLR